MISWTNPEQCCSCLRGVLGRTKGIVGKHPLNSWPQLPCPPRKNSWSTWRILSRSLLGTNFRPKLKEVLWVPPPRRSWHSPGKRRSAHLTKPKQTKSSLKSHVRKAGRKKGWRTSPSFNGDWHPGARSQGLASCCSLQELFPSDDICWTLTAHVLSDPGSMFPSVL